MNVCVEWWTALSAYVDDALPPDDRQRVEAHLLVCDTCRQALVELQMLRQALRFVPSHEPPPMLKARILSATVDQPTWSERLAMRWRQWAWRASLVGAAAAAVALIAWRFIPHDVPQAVNTIVSGARENWIGSVSPQISQTSPAAPRNAAAVSGTSRAESQPSRPAARARKSVAKQSAPREEVRWRAVARAPIAPEPAPADALQGEPVIEDDVPYIDVNSPPAGSGEQVAAQPEDAESRTVARRFALPAEVFSQGTSSMESLREQIRIRNQEQMSGEMKRKLQRQQVDVDVITVRF